MSKEYDRILEILESQSAHLKEHLTLIWEQGQQIQTLKFVCAALLAELALTKKNPHDEVERMLTSLQGVVAGVAAATDGASSAMTKMIEEIVEIVEETFPPRKP